MAVEYTFYSTDYCGDSITEENWASTSKRAQDVLDRYKRIYTVTAPEKNSEAMAVCAIADAINYFDAMANSFVSSSIGSVSSSRQAVDTSPKGQEKEFYRCASLYLEIYRGVS